MIIISVYGTKDSKIDICGYKFSVKDTLRVGDRFEYDLGNGISCCRYYHSNGNIKSEFFLVNGAMPVWKYSTFDENGKLLVIRFIKYFKYDFIYVMRRAKKLGYIKSTDFNICYYGKTEDIFQNEWTIISKSDTVKQYELGVTINALTGKEDEYSLIISE